MGKQWAYAHCFLRFSTRSPDTMAGYELLPLYKAAMVLMVYIETV